MASSRARELIRLSKQIMKGKIMAFIGAGGHAIHPPLNDPRVVCGLLILGAATQAWHYSKVVLLFRVRADRPRVARVRPPRHPGGFDLHWL